jgi:hypothetical protein
MTISESQLDTWSNPGATAGSALTYASIKAALDAHAWPVGMEWTAYLQGSYANTTNIRGNSDVDVVVEMTSVFYSDLTEAQKQARGFTSSGRFRYADLRREVLAALQNYYGATAVDASGPNAIVVVASGSRLKADVLPCVLYRRYAGVASPVEGVTFWNQQTQEQKINFPKIHIDNGSIKNNNTCTNGWYKPSVRMFKNARERIIGSSDELRKRYSSYFVECLLYNVPNTAFGTSYVRTYVDAVNFLAPALNDNRAQTFTTQSQQQFLFGTASTQWTLDNAKRFVADLIALWNK